MRVTVYGLRALWWPRCWITEEGHEDKGIIIGLTLLECVKAEHRIAKV